MATSRRRVYITNGGSDMRKRCIINAYSNAFIDLDSKAVLNIGTITINGSTHRMDTYRGSWGVPFQYNGLIFIPNTISFTTLKTSDSYSGIHVNSMNWSSVSSDGSTISGPYYDTLVYDPDSSSFSGILPRLEYDHGSNKVYAYLGDKRNIMELDSSLKGVKIINGYPYVNFSSDTIIENSVIYSMDYDCYAAKIDGTGVTKVGNTEYFYSSSSWLTA